MTIPEVVKRSTRLEGLDLTRQPIQCRCGRWVDKLIEPSDLKGSFWCETCVNDFERALKQTQVEAISARNPKS